MQMHAVHAHTQFNDDIFSLSIVFSTVPPGQNVSAAAENSNATIKMPGFTTELEIELSQVQSAKEGGMRRTKYYTHPGLHDSHTRHWTSIASHIKVTYICLCLLYTACSCCCAKRHLVRPGDSS